MDKLLTSQGSSAVQGYNPIRTGQTAIAIAILAVVSIATLILLYSGLPVFGPINDLTNAVSGLFSALLVWRLYSLLRARAPGWPGLLLSAAWAGCAAIIVNSILVAVGLMHWTTGGMYTAVGYGLLGVWFLRLNRLPGGLPFLTPGLARLGAIAGVAMLFGLLAGPLLAAGVDFTANPLIGVAYAGAAAGWLLYPLWCWRVGRRLLVE